MPISNVFNVDCLEYMRGLPDKFFDLAVVDPPYGIKHSTIAGKQSGSKYGKAAAAKRVYDTKDWDNEPPPFEYFIELNRVSKNQIIWGANHFISRMPFDSAAWIFWNKDNGTNNFSDGDLAFTSFKKGLRMVKITWNGMIQSDMKNKEVRFHPTQKPVALYLWLLENYGQGGVRFSTPTWVASRAE